jgi:hypothetical protein
MTAEEVELLKTVATATGVIVAIGALFLNAYATLRNVQSRRLLNYHELIKSHRDLWRLLLEKPEQYGRVTAKAVDLTASPITDAERSFVHLVFLHMTSAYYFSRSSDIVKIEKLKMDFDELIALPIPGAVWAEHARYFNDDFVRFVDRRQAPRGRIGRWLGLSNTTSSPSALW